jgi:ActR/RegA family two-component response regulator
MNPQWTASKETILVADDDVSFRDKIANYFGDQGFRVRCADHAEQVAAALEAGVTLASIEPNLPGRAWPALLEMLAKQRGRINWIVVTSFPSRALTKASLRAGACGVLGKPAAPLQVYRSLMEEEFGAGRRTPSALSLSQMSLARVEWEFMNLMLVWSDGNICRAARRLRIPRQTLYRKLRRHPPSN